MLAMTHSSTGKDNQGTVRFGTWQYNFDDDSLNAIGEDGSLTPVVLDNICKKTLAYLVRNPERVISREELLKNVWGVSGVTDLRITRAMSILRRDLNDDVMAPRYILTISKSGYRFIGLTTQHNTNTSLFKFRSKLLVAGGAFTFGLVLLIWCIYSLLDLYNITSLSESDLSDEVGYPHDFTLSPNSEHLAFINTSASDSSSSGDLIIKNLKTNEFIALIKKPSSANLAVPAWNPKHNKIAFKTVTEHKLCQINVVTLDESLTKVVHEADPVKCDPKMYFLGFMVWSKDGENLFYSDVAPASSNMAIFKLDTRTGFSDQITSAPSSSIGDYYAIASKEGNELLYLRDESRTLSQLWTLNMETSEQSKVYSFPASEYPSFVEYSLDGNGYIYQAKSKMFTLIDKKSLKLKPYAKSSELASSMKFCKTGKMLSTVSTREQSELVIVSNPFLTDVASVQQIKSGDSYWVNPNGSLPDVYFEANGTNSEVWLAHKNGQNELFNSISSQHFNMKAVFSTDGKMIATVLGNEVSVSDLEGNKRVLNKEGQILIRPSWGSGNATVFAISPEDDWDLFAINTSTGEQKLYLSGVTFFHQSPNGRFDVVVKYNSDEILLKDLIDKSITKILLPDFVNGKEIKVLFSDDFMYIKCARCTLPGFEKSQVLARVNLKTKDIEVTHFDVVGEDKEFAFAENGNKFIVDKRNLRDSYRLRVLSMAE